MGSAPEGPEIRPPRSGPDGARDPGARIGVAFRDGLLHHEVESGALKRSPHAQGFVAGRGNVVFDLQHQAVAGGKGKVVIDVGVARDVDLGRQGAMPFLDDVEVDVLEMGDSATSSGVLLTRFRAVLIFGVNCIFSVGDAVASLDSFISSLTLLDNVSSTISRPTL